MDLFKSNQIIKAITPPKELNISDIVFRTTTETVMFNKNLGVNHVLETHKKKLDNIHKNIWHNISFLANPCEYIHPKMSKYFKYEVIVGGEKPISRAYYKLWEIMNMFPIFETTMTHHNFLYCNDKRSIPNNCVIAHLAEGPGGFTQAVMKKRFMYRDEIYAITLPSKNKNKLLNNVDQKINISYGNLTHIDAIKEFAKKFENNKAYFVTADGGFNDEDNENIQEHLHTHLIFSEILSSLMIQATNGCFVCKIYDVNTNVTVFLIKLLSFHYEKTYLFKPLASRPINSEKYIICMGFHGIQKMMLDKLIQIKEKWSEIDESGMMKTNGLFLSSLFKSSLNCEDLRAFNFLYTSQQQKYINFAIRAVDYLQNTTFLNKIKTQQMRYSIEWCRNNNVDIHTRYKSPWNEYHNDVLYTNDEELVIKNTFSPIYKALQENDENMVHILSDHKDCYQIQLFVHAYQNKQYHMLSYLLTKVKLEQLIYLLTSDEILDVLHILGYIQAKQIVLPLSPYICEYLREDDNHRLFEYVYKYYKMEYIKHTLNTPSNNLKMMVKNEKMSVIKQIVKNPSLSVHIMKYSIYYNNTNQFIVDLFKLVPHYMFTEQDVIKNIKYGNKQMVEFMLRNRNVKIYTPKIVGYCMNYEYSSQFIVNVLSHCKNYQQLDLYALLKRNHKEADLILSKLKELKYKFNSLTIQDCIKNSVPQNVLVLLYKYEFLSWSDRDIIFLKDKINNTYIQQIKNFVEYQSNSMYNNNGFNCLES